MFLYDNHWKFWSFSILHIWNKFSAKCEPFSKNSSTVFSLKVLRLKMQHFHTKVSYQKPILRTVERGVRDGLIKKNRVLPVTASFFRKFCFSLGTSYKYLTCCTINPNVPIYTILKHWSFILRDFFLVNILKFNILDTTW